MQHYLDVFFKGVPGLLLLAFALMGIVLIISCVKGSQEKRLNKELMESMACKDEVLEEFKKIRHEYNNILQTITCFIEEDLNGLKEYKSKLLEKSHLLNKNNLTQLVKIKDKNILSLVYKLYMKAKDSGKTLNLTIYNDIVDISSCNTELNNVLQDYLKNAYELAIKENVEINLKISASDMGLRFCYENSLSVKNEILPSKSTKSNRNLKVEKDIFFNTFLQNDLLIQEILITFDH